MLKRLHIIDKWLIAATAFLFILLYLTLSFNDRPISDDLLFIYMIKSKGAIPTISYFYETWSGRWASVAYFAMVVGNSSLITSHYFIFLYYLLTFILFIYSINEILTSVSKVIFHTELKPITGISFSVLFIATFYFFTFQSIESWWWICASFTYLQGIVMLVFGTAMIIRQNKNLLHYILICISFVYVGASYEIYSLIAICLFFLALIFMSLQVSYKELLRHPSAKAFLTGLVSLMISAVSCFISPGNFARRNEYIQYFSYNADLYRTISVVMQKKYIVGLLLSSLWMTHGFTIRETQNVPLRTLNRVLFIAFIPFVLSILITITFQYVVLPGAPLPLRSWTFTGFGAALFLCALFVRIGFAISQVPVFVKGAVMTILTAAAFLSLSIVVGRQHRSTSAYAKSYDELIATVEASEHKAAGDTIFVKPLPEPGMLIKLSAKSVYDMKNLKAILDVKGEIVERDSLLP